MTLTEQLADARAKRYCADMIDEPVKRVREMTIYDAKISELSTSVAIQESDFVYDVETYPNVFTLICKNAATGERWIFEISDRINQGANLVRFLYWLQSIGARMVGFNNVGFDYPVIHHLLMVFNNQGYVTAADLYQKCQQIFASQYGNRFANIIWERDRIVPQLDLYKIHHFDNKAKTTGLKALEFNMRSYTIADLPFEPGTFLTPEQIDTLIIYNAHDVNETLKFYHHSFGMIRFRDELSRKYNADFTNYNDTKIGKEFFIMKLEEAIPGSTFTMTGRKKNPRQTPRPAGINLSQVIFPYISFQTPILTSVLDYMKSVTITDTRKSPELKDLKGDLNGFELVFGSGGIHGSVSGRAVHATADCELIDVDVKSFYPNIAIVNRVYPEHLSEGFCDIYKTLYDMRAGYAKGTPENAMIKLALNGVYGDSNNEYSPFFDPAYTMAITVNGQLLLSMLAERFSIAGIELVQINTDGMSVLVRRDQRAAFDDLCKRWQAFTMLELESVNYRSMFIRDVNNYIAVDLKGKVKRKGAYQWNIDHPGDPSQSLGWHQDWSALVVQRAAEECLVRGVPVEQYVYNHPDPYDFMLRAKVNKSSRLVLSSGKKLQSTTRYQIATVGESMAKIMPELAKKPDSGERTFSVEKGWLVHICDHVTDYDWNILDRRYYIEEAKKLTECIQ